MTGARGREVRIRIDGLEISVPAGISIAAALLAQGHWHFRRSPNGHPRAPLCGMGTCFECRVTVDGRRGVRSCQASVEEGMEIELSHAC